MHNNHNTARRKGRRFCARKFWVFFLPVKAHGTVTLFFWDYLLKNREFFYIIHVISSFIRFYLIVFVMMLSLCILSETGREAGHGKSLPLPKATSAVRTERCLYEIWIF